MSLDAGAASASSDSHWCVFPAHLGSPRGRFPPGPARPPSFSASGWNVLGSSGQERRFAEGAGLDGPTCQVLEVSFAEDELAVRGFGGYDHCLHHGPAVQRVHQRCSLRHLPLGCGDTGATVRDASLRGRPGAPVHTCPGSPPVLETMSPENAPPAGVCPRYDSVPRRSSKYESDGGRTPEPQRDTRATLPDVELGLQEGAAGNRGAGGAQGLLRNRGQVLGGERQEVCALF